MYMDGAVVVHGHVVNATSDHWVGKRWCT